MPVCGQRRWLASWRDVQSHGFLVWCSTSFWKPFSRHLSYSWSNASFRPLNLAKWLGLSFKRKYDHKLWNPMLNTTAYVLPSSFARSYPQPWVHCWLGDLCVSAFVLLSDMLLSFVGPCCWTCVSLAVVCGWHDIARWDVSRVMPCHAPIQISPFYLNVFVQIVKTSLQMMVIGGEHYPKW